MKKVSLFVALALVGFLAIPAYAEVQNIRVSGDVHSLGVYRDNFDLRTTSGTSNDDDEDFIITYTRVRVDADLTDNVSATVRLLNEREWGEEDDAQNEDGDSRVAVDLSYVTLGEFLYSPLTLMIGRQELGYGNKLVIGDVDSNASSRQTGIAQEFSKRKAFDSVRAVLDFDPIVIDTFHAILAETGTSSQDWTVSGVDASYALGDYDANLAGYWVWSKHADNSGTPTPPQLGGIWTTSTNLGRSIHTLGGRGDITPTPALNLGGELAFQTGEYSDGRDQNAMAAQLNGSYTFDAKMRPVVRAAFAHFSGEEAAGTGDQDSWIAAHEDQRWGIIADRMQLSTISGSTCSGSTNDCPQSANTNMNIFNLGADLEPLEDVTLSVDWYNYSLDEANVNAVGSGNNEVFTTNDDYGDEVDVVVAYDYTEDVTFNGSFAWFGPGNAWDSDAQDEALQVTGGVLVAF